MPFVDWMVATAVEESDLLIRMKYNAIIADDFSMIMFYTRLSMLPFLASLCMYRLLFTVHPFYLRNTLYIHTSV